MKILAVTGGFLPEAGGMQYSTHQTLLALTQQGVEVTLLCPDYPSAQEVDEQIPYQIIRVPGSGYISAWKRVKKIRYLWQMQPFDHILLMGHHEEIAYGVTSFLYPISPVILAAGTRLPFPGGIVKRWVRNNLLCRAYSKASKIIAISPATESYIKTFCSGFRVPVFQIPRPIDGTVWKKMREKKNDGFVLATVSRLEEDKNIQEVLQVVASIQKEIPNLQYWVIGDGSYRKTLEGITRNLGLENIVKFYGLCHPEKVVEILHDVDLFILISRCNGKIGESFGRVYVEAAALGIPSIGYNSLGVIVAVDDGVSGSLCEFGDIECVTNKIRELANSREMLEKMSSNALEHYKDYFTMKKVGAKFVEVLDV